MAYVSTSPLFRSLDDTEEAQFREYARNNPPPPETWEALHPVCREEWLKRGLGPEGGSPSPRRSPIERVTASLMVEDPAADLPARAAFPTGALCSSPREVLADLLMGLAAELRREHESLGDDAPDRQRFEIRDPISGRKLGSLMMQVYRKEF
jgi:hypothetical protein